MIYFKSKSKVFVFRLFYVSRRSARAIQLKERELLDFQDQ